MRVPLMNARESHDPVRDTSMCDAGVAKGGWVCFWMRAAVRDSGGLAKIGSEDQEVLSRNFDNDEKRNGENHDVAVFDADLIASKHSSSYLVCPSSCYCDDKGEYVSCVGDGLWRFPEDIPNSTVRLELRNYLVSELLQQDLCDLVVLEELKLQQSHIETVDNATFASNPKLEGLDLSQNSLTSLSSSIFTDLSRLRHL
ncbi:leucine-rich repeat-containing protein 15 [Caerostris extrusa]|uniref:Leucine-rich repeat-containing protein 15 n=1 Tax=Caerostris extrusa TaxID=172846 RepID=A0AAV4R3I3_CAEEX|nr:leucine-rich repeat-containing protein 15 [Caerostris extrusa]